MDRLAATAQQPRVYSFVTQPPSFPGGEVALSRYLRSNLKIVTEDALGHATVQFVIDTLGCVYDVKSMDSARAGALDRELIRVVKRMPAWNPGRHEGKKVAVQFYLPFYACPPQR